MHTERLLAGSPRFGGRIAPKLSGEPRGGAHGSSTCWTTTSRWGSGPVALTAAMTSFTRHHAVRQPQNDSSRYKRRVDANSDNTLHKDAAAILCHGKVQWLDSRLFAPRGPIIRAAPLHSISHQTPRLQSFVGRVACRLKGQ
jgi:hypothetical protein